MLDVIAKRMPHEFAYHAPSDDPFSCYRTLFVCGTVAAHPAPINDRLCRVREPSGTVEYGVIETAITSYEAPNYVVGPNPRIRQRPGVTMNFVAAPRLDVEVYLRVISQRRARERMFQMPAHIGWSIRRPA